MAHEFILYLRKLAKNLFSGFSIFLGFIDILSFCFHFTLPDFPLYITAVLTIVIILIGSYRVWLEELAEKDKAQKELFKIKNKIPNYSIKTRVDSDIFSIKEKISSVDREIEEEKNNLNDKCFLSGLLPEMKVLGGEKPEAKIRRLTKYRQELEKYDKDIKNLHRISIEISSNKNDENVEIELKTANSDPLFIEDDYVINNMPTTSDPSRPYTWINNNIQVPPIATNDYVRPDNMAKIFLKELNPKQRYEIPDQELYIKTNNREATFIITIYSKNLQEPKVIREKVNLK